MSAPDSPATEGAGLDPWRAARLTMVDGQIAARGVRDARVLDAMREVPRHAFVPAPQREHAYDDYPLSIGHDQTISQPYIVALMTELARPRDTDVVLEIGTGSGYQTAVLARLAGMVHSIERVAALADSARACLSGLGCANVAVRLGDGYDGCPAAAPFDAIVVTAAPETVPPALVAQLAPGGRLVIPVGPVWDIQQLLVMEKTVNGTTTTVVIPVRFVPLRRGCG